VCIASGYLQSALNISPYGLDWLSLERKTQWAAQAEFDALGSQSKACVLRHVNDVIDTIIVL